MFHYNIEIKVQPEFLSGKLMFFWCITKNTEYISSNCGHGWSCSIEEAASHAHIYYEKNISSNT